MPTTTKPRAVELAVSHCGAWSNHDWEAARTALADDVTVTARSPRPSIP